MRKIIYLLLFLIFCLSPSPLFAQSDSPLLLQQSTVSASPSVEIQASVQTIMARIKAAADRVDKISQRISLRFQFLSRSGIKNITRLNTQYNNLTGDMVKLKLDLSRLEEAASSFLSSSDYKKDYQAYRKEIINVREELKNILLNEKSLIADMKRYTSSAVLPTIIPTKAKVVSPTKKAI